MAKIRTFFRDFWENFQRHDLMSMAAALAFYTALSLAPLLLISISVLGWLGQKSTDEFIGQIRVVIGPQASEAINLIAENAKDRQDLSSLTGIIGAVVLVFSASGVFAQLQSALNKIWDVEADPNESNWAWVKRRLASMGVVMSLGFLSIVSLALSTLLNLVLTRTGLTWGILTDLIALGAFGLLFAAIYKVLPDRPLDWRHSIKGGIVTAILFTIGKQLIGLYLGEGAIGSAYGAAGSLIVFLVWVYYSSIILFIGAEITVQLKGGRAAHAKNLRLSPNKPKPEDPHPKLAPTS